MSSHSMSSKKTDKPDNTSNKKDKKEGKRSSSRGSTDSKDSDDKQKEKVPAGQSVSSVRTAVSLSEGAKQRKGSKKKAKKDKHRDKTPDEDKKKKKTSEAENEPKKDRKHSKHKKKSKTDEKPGDEKERKKKKEKRRSKSGSKSKSDRKKDRSRSKKHSKHRDDKDDKDKQERSSSGDKDDGDKAGDDDKPSSPPPQKEVTPELAAKRLERWRVMRTEMQQTLVFGEYYVKLLKVHFIDKIDIRVYRKDQLKRRDQVFAPTLQLAKLQNAWWHDDKPEMIRVKDKESAQIHVCSALVPILNRLTALHDQLSDFCKSVLAPMSEFACSQGNHQYASQLPFWPKQWHALKKRLGLLSDIWKMPELNNFDACKDWRPMPVVVFLGEFENKKIITGKMRTLQGRCNLTTAVMTLITADAQLMLASMPKDVKTLDRAKKIALAMERKLPRLFQFPTVTDVDERVLTQMRGVYTDFDAKVVGGGFALPLKSGGERTDSISTDSRSRRGGGKTASSGLEGETGIQGETGGEPKTYPTDDSYYPSTGRQQDTSVRADFWSKEPQPDFEEPSLRTDYGTQSSTRDDYPVHRRVRQDYRGEPGVRTDYFAEPSLRTDYGTEPSLRTDYGQNSAYRM